MNDTLRAAADISFQRHAALEVSLPLGSLLPDLQRAVIYAHKSGNKTVHHLLLEALRSCRAARSILHDQL